VSLPARGIDADIHQVSPGDPPGSQAAPAKDPNSLILELHPSGPSKDAKNSPSGPKWQQKIDPRSRVIEKRKKKNEDQRICDADRNLRGDPP